jgi:hypothetical protein
MKIMIADTTLQDMQRFTALARVTDDAVLRADYHRRAECCRDHAKDGPSTLLKH